MKTLSQLLVLLTAMLLLGGCINPDQGGQGGKMKDSTATSSIK